MNLISEEKAWHFISHLKIENKTTHSPCDVKPKNRHSNKPLAFKMFVLLFNSKAIISHASDSDSNANIHSHTHMFERRK